MVLWSRVFPIWFMIEVVFLIFGQVTWKQVTQRTFDRVFLDLYVKLDRLLQHMETELTYEDWIDKY